MKVGKEENRILDYLKAQNGSAYLWDISHKFAPFYRKAGDRTGSTLHYVVWNRINKMAKKKLIIISNPNLTNCKIKLFR